MTLALFILAAIAAVASVASLVLAVLARDETAKVHRGLGDVRKALLSLRFASITPIPPSPVARSPDEEPTRISAVPTAARSPPE